MAGYPCMSSGWRMSIACLYPGGTEYSLEGMDCFWTECLLYSKRWNIFRAERGSEESLFLIYPGWHPCRGLEPCTHPRGVGSPSTYEVLCSDHDVIHDACHVLAPRVEQSLRLLVQSL